MGVRVFAYMYVGMFQHNSETPGAISTKLGTHKTVVIKLGKLGTVEERLS